MLSRKAKQTIKQYLAERPSVHIGFEWDAEGFMFLCQNSGDVYVIKVKRSEVMDALSQLTVVGEDCSDASGGGWHLRINGAKALFNWVMAKTNGLYTADRLEKVCTVEEWDKKVEEFQAMKGHAQKNRGRTAEWVLENHFEGCVVNPHNDRKNSNESDITLADGSCWEIKCIVGKSRAQIKVQD